MPDRKKKINERYKGYEVDCEWNKTHDIKIESGVPIPLNLKKVKQFKQVVQHFKNNPGIADKFVAYLTEHNGIDDNKIANIRLIESVANGTYKSA